MTNLPSSSQQAPDPAAVQATEAMIQSTLEHLAAPGSFFTGEERLAMATAARHARGLGEPEPSMPSDISEHVARVAAAAMTTRREHTEAWVTAGGDILAYVELVSVVARISGIDSFRLGLGQALDPLPEPLPGEPVPAIADDVRLFNSWVPTTGPALAPTALSALPNESASKREMGVVWYIADDMVHSYDTDPGLEISRPQMELVASRTSWLNECFF